jgi:hypothetical protein
MKVRNKLECLIVASISNLPKWSTFQFLLLVKLLALLRNIRVGWKNFTGTNTPVYYQYLYIMDKKKFYNIVHRTTSS